ncbi:MAG: pyruvate formate lyase-activating protein [Chloroflexi bacterium]|nr:pyruvate formate lyase-activating protein [Chloroflexota bacterium]
MRILAIDIGGGTQDILLFDSSVPIENCLKMVMPSPTHIVARRIEVATRRGQPIVLTGFTMGGGPNQGAVKDHIRAGLPAYATPDAARSFDDDLSQVEALGVKLVSEDEARQIKGAEVIELRDVDLKALGQAFSSFGVRLDFDALSIGVLDHGAAPPEVSDRRFRFDYLAKAMRQRNDFSSFIFLASEVPDFLTRMRAVADSLPGLDVPLLLMDTAPLGALGALEDGEVRRRRERLVVNLGNMHTMACRLRGDAILGLFEHHTGQLTTQKLDGYLSRFLSGELSSQEVFDDHGHGCLILEKRDSKPFLAVTGPRRALMAESILKPYFAIPHGDMMLSGSFGLVRAFALKVEAWREEIQVVLGA